MAMTEAKKLESLPKGKYKGALFDINIHLVIF